MREIWAARLASKAFKELVREGNPALLVFGSGPARLYVLPLSERHDKMIQETYRPGLQINVHHRSLTGSIVSRILIDQVDADFQPWTYGALKVNGDVVAYLVPASPWWKAKVEAGE